MKGIAKIGLLILSLLGVLTVHAQLRKERPLTNPAYDLGKPIHFGFSLGINMMDAEIANSGSFVIDDNGKNVLLWSDVSQLSPGFNVNIISELRFSEYFALRFLPGMAFGQRSVSFYQIRGGQLSDTLYHKMKIESSMIEFPLLIKYSAKRHNDFKPYLVGGINPRYDLAAKKKFSEGVYVGFNTFDVYLEMGVGFDIYLPYFKFSTELKYSRGLFDMLSSRKLEGYEHFPKSLKGVTSDMIVISFHFE